MTRLELYSQLETGPYRVNFIQRNFDLFYCEEFLESATALKDNVERLILVKKFTDVKINFSPTKEREVFFIKNGVGIDVRVPVYFLEVTDNLIPERLLVAIDGLIGEIKNRIEYLTEQINEDI